MIRIYLIDDVEQDFKDITKAIYNSLGSERVTVLPKINSKDTNKYTNWSKITDEILSDLGSNPDQVPDKLFKDLSQMNIDYYIIDNCLSNPRANDGKDILKVFAEKGVPKDRLILYSGDSIPVVLPDGYTVLQKESNHSSLLKYLLNDTGIKPVNNFWYQLTYANSKLKFILGGSIVTILKIMTIVAFAVGVYSTWNSGYHLYKNELSSSNNSSVHSVNNKIDFVNDPEFKKFQLEHNFQFTVSELNSDSGYQINLTDTVAKAKMILSFPVSNNSKHNVIGLLEFIEGIFLNFLPFFILFGFLSYCSSYLVLVWASANPAKLNPEQATKILKFSKALFISSIIATVIINLLEGLIKNQSLINLIPHFILIIILCIYYLALEKAESE